MTAANFVISNPHFHQAEMTEEMHGLLGKEFDFLFSSGY
jgi:hypothetical protein